MCEPITASMALMAVSTAASAGGAIYSGIKQEEAAEYSAKVAEQNAEASLKKAAYDEEAQREKVKRLLSTQRAAYGKSGVDLTGSPLLVLEDTAAQGELDALAIRYGGEIEAGQQKSKAELYRLQGQTAKTEGFIKAGTTILSATGKSAR